jgi:hypothetical protein
MRKFAEVASVLAAIALLTLLPAQTARAQQVSGGSAYVATNGSDSNQLCSHVAPCLTFARAISVIQAGGTVRCIDQLGLFGPFSAVTITQSINRLQGDRRSR